MSLFEAEECVNNIIEAAGNGLDVKLGVSINEQLGDQILVSVIASDFEGESNIDNPMSAENLKAQKKEINLEDAKIINEIFINSSLLLTLEFVLQNELIKEVVEIKKTVNVNASKKKKKKKNTEKNSYLVIDSEKLKKILIEPKEVESEKRWNHWKN